jgi:putative ATPase
LPDVLEGAEFYHPVERGLELKLREKLQSLREARKQARKT